MQGCGNILGGGGILCRNILRVVVNDGLKVSFWHDVRCEERPLNISYPKSYNIYHHKDAWVVEKSKLKMKPFIKISFLQDLCKIGRRLWFLPFLRSTISKYDNELW